MAPHDEIPPNDGDADFLRRAWCYLESRLSKDEMPQFQDELTADPEKRRRFVQLCLTRAALIEELSKQSNDATAPDSGQWQATGTVATKTPLSSKNRGTPGTHPAAMRQLPLRISAWRIAAVLVFVATAVMTLTSPLWMGWKKAAPLATLADAVDAQWDMPQQLDVGDDLPSGPLDLKAGYAQITLSNGVNLVLKGPAHFSVDSLRLVQLDQGKLTADVPHTASGFTIKMPTASVTDLGTIFGVTAFANGEGEVQVLKGKVQAKLLAEDGVTKVQTELTEDHAAAFNPNLGTMVSIPVKPDAYVTDIRHIPAAPQTPYDRWLAYSTKLRKDPSLLAYYTFDNKDEASDKLLNRAAATSGKFDGQIENAAWDDGRFPGKQALQFNGNNSRVKVNIPAQMNQLTLAIWLRMDSLAHANSLLMSDDWNRQGQIHWQIDSQHLSIAEFQSGQEQNGGFAEDSPSPADAVGHWVLWVATLDAQTSTIALYRNGIAKATKKTSDAVPMLIGAAQIGSWDPVTCTGQGGTTRRTLDGRIDEMAVFKRVLNPQEIQTMYRAGRNEK